MTSANTSLPAGGRCPGKVSGYLGPDLAAGNKLVDFCVYQHFHTNNISIPTTDTYQQQIHTNDKSIPTTNPYRNSQTRWLPIIVGHLPSRSCILSLTDSSAFHNLDLGPGDVPFELRPSHGKGWGGFATRKIMPGDLIFEEEPLFAIRKPLKDVTEIDVREAFQRLSTDQKRQSTQHKIMRMRSCIFHRLEMYRRKRMTIHSGRPPVSYQRQ